MAQVGRSVKHYHANNGRFADNWFVDATNRKYQKLTFCCVGAHHYNGIIGKKMSTTSTRPLLLHGIIMWPQMIDYMFWLFALKSAAKQLNSL